MFKLPKIAEESSPLMNQYKGVVLSKFPNHKNQFKQSKYLFINQRYDWITCELQLAQPISNDFILKTITNYQLICKEKNIHPFYSYFFLKSLFLNKTSREEKKQNPQSSKDKPFQSHVQNSSRPLTGQIQQYLIRSVEQESNKIQFESSVFHKILNCIRLREQLLINFFDTSKDDSHNLIHQNANNIRYLNFQIFDMIKSWKSSLIELQTQIFSDQDIQIDELSTIEPFFVYDDQNYLCKMIYDNANVICALNSKKQGKFISPPNPFFLSQDGNKESMSQKEKDKIGEVMELIAKQKAFELKNILQQPEYIAKKRETKNMIRSSSTSRIPVNKSITSTKKDDPFKKLFGSLTKLQIPQNRYSLTHKEKINTFDPPKDKKVLVSSQRGKTQSSNIISVYQARASKLREQVQKNTQNRDRFENMIKKPELQVVKDTKKKKTPPKQTLPRFMIELKTYEERLMESPYRERISSLRREVEKNVRNIKMARKEADQLKEAKEIKEIRQIKLVKQPTNIEEVRQIQENRVVQEINEINEALLQREKLEESMLTFKSRKSIKGPSIEVKTVTPKMKIIEEKQVSIENLPNPTIIPEKTQDQKNNKDKSLSRSKEKEEGRKCYSTFFKTPEEQEMQKSMMKESKAQKANRVMLDPVVNERITTLKRNSSQLNHFATTSNFYPKEKKASLDINSKIDIKRRTSQQAVMKSQVSNKQSNVGNIDSSLRNLKQRLRNIEIINAYGRKKRNPRRREEQQNSLQRIKEDDYIEKVSRVSPKKTEHKNKSTLLKREAQQLEMKIQKLLQKQNKTFRFQSQNQLIHYENEYNYRTVQKMRDQDSQKMSETQSIYDENLNFLQKKKKLIQQSNQIKEKEIQETTKNKQKISQEIIQRKERLRLMEDKIQEIKQKRKANVSHSEEELKQSILNESRELVAGEQAMKVKKLQQTQSEMKKQNQELHQQMIIEEQRFIKLKEQEYRMREELNKKKHLDELHEVKTKYLQKQQEYEQKILDEEKARKQNEIRLMKQKRQAQELQMKLHEQEMKELLLKDILEKQHQRWSKQQQEADQYHEEVKQLFTKELKEKEEQEWEMNRIYMQENYKLLQLMNEMRQKNFRIQEANRQRLLDVERAISEKQEEIRKLDELQKEVEKLEKSRIQTLGNGHDEDNHVEHQPETLSMYQPLEEDDLQDLKLRLKEQILKEMIERRKQEEEEELKFEEQRKRRLKILQTEIKDFLRKQGEISKVLEYARPQEIRHINVQTILNREILNQESREIQAKSKVIQESKRQLLAQKDMITSTTDYPTLNGQRASEKPIFKVQNNKKEQNFNSSLRQVLESHQNKKIQTEQIHQLENSQIQIPQAKKSKLENKIESNVVSFVNPVSVVQQTETPDLSKIQEVDKSQFFVLSRQSTNKQQIFVQEKKKDAQVSKINIFSNVFSVTNDVYATSPKKPKSKRESSKDVQESNSVSKYQDKQKGSKQQVEESSSSRKNSQKPPVQPKSKDIETSNDEMRKSRNKVYQKTSEKQQQTSRQKSRSRSRQNFSEQVNESPNKRNTRSEQNILERDNYSVQERNYEKSLRRKDSKQKVNQKHLAQSEQGEFRNNKIRSQKAKSQMKQKDLQDDIKHEIKSSKKAKEDNVSKSVHQSELKNEKDKIQQKRKNQIQSSHSQENSAAIKRKSRSKSKTSRKNSDSKIDHNEDSVDKKLHNKSKEKIQQKSKEEKIGSAGQKQNEESRSQVHPKKPKKIDSSDEKNSEKHHRQKSSRKPSIKNDEPISEKINDSSRQKTKKIQVLDEESQDQVDMKVQSSAKQLARSNKQQIKEKDQQQSREKSKKSLSNSAAVQKQQNKEKSIEKIRQNKQIKGEDHPEKNEKAKEISISNKIEQTHDKNSIQPEKKSPQKIQKAEEPDEYEVKQKNQEKHHQNHSERSKSKQPPSVPKNENPKQKTNQAKESENSYESEKTNTKNSQKSREQMQKQKLKESQQILEKDANLKNSKSDIQGRQISKKRDKTVFQQQEQDDGKFSPKVEKKKTQKQEVSKEMKTQKEHKQIEKELPTQRSQEIHPVNTSIDKKFGQISSIQQISQNKRGQTQIIQQSNLTTTQKQNETFEDSRSVGQKIYKSDEEMLKKFQALKEYLQPEAQFVTIEEGEIKDFVQKFYAAYPEEVQEMFSFTRGELLTILKNFRSMERKIDLFSTQSIGWFDRSNNKYILIGSLGCVHLIAQKYGETQIQMSYIFNRSNHKQKKFLVKEIKVFEKVGSLFQKKLSEDNQYSLKLIIKITKDMVPGQSHIPDQLVEFNSLVTLRPPGAVKANSKTSPFDKQKYIFQHILADCMWKNMKKEEIEEYAKTNFNQSIDLNVFVKSLQSFNDDEASDELKEYITYDQEMTSQLNMYFKLPYIQLGNRIHYELSAHQYQLKNGQKVYLSKHMRETEDQEELWNFLVFEAPKKIIENNFLETLIKAKVKQINKLKPERELKLLLPFFKIKSKFTASENEGLKQNFKHESTIEGDLIASSISCSNSTSDSDRKLITLSKKTPDLGFVFCACYSPQGKIEKAVTGAWVGYKDLIK